MRAEHAKKEAIISTVSVFATAIVFGLSIITAFYSLKAHFHGGIMSILSNILFIFLIGIFAYGNFLYQITRSGYHLRLGKHLSDRMQKNPVTFYIEKNEPPLLQVLIPSYKEGISTVLQTLVSAVLMGYPNKRVCLLLDDPVAAAGTPDHKQTNATIKMVQEISKRIARAHTHYEHLYVEAEKRLASNYNANHEQQNLIRVYAQFIKWLKKTGLAYEAKTHTDNLFIKIVFNDAADIYIKHVQNLAKLDASTIGRERLLHEYRYIKDMLHTDIQCFQRKSFLNLSHEPNKAMNINSYLSLMGGSYKTIIDHDGTKMLHKTPLDSADFVVPSSDFVITLDADSIVDHTYAAVLIEHMLLPGNEKVAVAQTPYSAISGAHNALERTAGATTDIQYIIHQGFTKFGATYWVGANALIRTTALKDIVESIPGQKLVRQYIQDRTVIEDTESSIDLISKGWSLYNHPDRLAFSATPNDYGSLLIQRRRWANGGLIILPKLLVYLLRKPSFRKIPEGFMRIHYLTSIALVNIGLVVMLFIPLQKVGFSAWVPLTAVPYFYLYYRDLRLLGYARLEIVRVYALNLLLVPINLGGVMKSIKQLITKAKIPFGRTPKIGARTTAPRLYHILNYSFIFYLIYDCALDITNHRYVFAALLSINVGFYVYAVAVFVGFRNSLSDIFRSN